MISLWSPHTVKTPQNGLKDMVSDLDHIFPACSFNPSFNFSFFDKWNAGTKEALKKM